MATMNREPFSATNVVMYKTYAGEKMLGKVATQETSLAKLKFT
jgi:hypothetical protein